MARDHGQGIFDMTDINLVASMSSLPNAKAIATAAVDRSTATDANKQKAMRMIHNSQTVKALMFGMTNFSLSHQGLKTI